ncbi:MAG: hypothetical protein QM718_09080 [Steroidobacteraceae bacterium]
MNFNLSAVSRALAWSRALPRISVMGVPRVGTNFTRAVLETNYRVRVLYNTYGWKHGLVPNLAADCSLQAQQARPLVVVKHPLSNLYSLYDYMQSVGMNVRSGCEDFASFLRQRVIYFCEKSRQCSELRFSNPVQLWNCVVWNHVRFAHQTGGLVIRYEDMLADPEVSTGRIARHFGLARIGADYSVTAKLTRRMSDKDSLRQHKYTDGQDFSKQGYFLRGGYLEHYRAEDLAFVAEQVDGELLTELRYSLEPSHLLGEGPLPRGVLPAHLLQRAEAG